MIPRCTFENFGVGPSNAVAWAAARRVAMGPPLGRNSLIIQGGPRSGKTHLLEAIDAYILRNRPGISVNLLLMQKFAHEYYLAEETGSLPRFRQRYQRLDVLLLDDAQFLAHCPQRVGGALRELFEAPRILVLACDCPVMRLRVPDRALRACLHMADAETISASDLETYRAILNACARDMAVGFPRPIIQQLALRLLRFQENAPAAGVVLRELAILAGKDGKWPDSSIVDAVLFHCRHANKHMH